MPTANTSVGISGILKLPRRTICLIESVKALLGIKINGCGMTWLPGAKIISFLICCSTSEVPNENMYVKKKKKKAVKRNVFETFSSDPTSSVPWPWISNRHCWIWNFNSVSISSCAGESCRIFFCSRLNSLPPDWQIKPSEMIQLWLFFFHTPTGKCS